MKKSAPLARWVTAPQIAAMHVMRVLLLSLTCLVCLSAASRAQASPAATASAPPSAEPSRLPADWHRGLCWVGPANAAEMQRVKELGANWVSITPFGYGQQSAQQIPTRYRHSRFRSESLDTMRKLTRMAHAQGLAVMLKPHLWYARGGEWRGDIRPQDEAAWWRFYRGYGEFLRPYLRMAQEEKVELFCIGTELCSTTDNEELWRKLIADARKIYPGQLSYAAHWREELWCIRFWDALDLVGVQAYFPLVEFGDRRATQAQMRGGWEPWMQRLRELASKTKKSILFTELGYQPRVGTTHEPWLWNMPTPYSEAAQRDAFAAFFQAAAAELAMSGGSAESKRPWLLGVHIWKWFSYTRRPHRRVDFSPQGLPAELVLRQWFRR